MQTKAVNAEAPSCDEVRNENVEEPGGNQLMHACNRYTQETREIR